jgi:hypothetical protein
MNNHSRYRTTSLRRRGAALGALAACSGLLALPACTVNLDDWPSTAAITPVEGAVGITRIPLTDAPDAGDAGEVTNAEVPMPDGGEPVTAASR